jgi:UDP-2,3-diacylglucosamine hydrolase
VSQRPSDRRDDTLTDTSERVERSSDDVTIRVGAGELALFGSDIHLHPQHSATADMFFDRIASAGADAAHLFLLGDIFEFWIGDDADNPYDGRLADALSTLARHGTRVWLMRGNRDFLLDVPVAGADLPYSARCGATMLDDPVVIDLHGTRTALVHGDAQCTDDLAYQKWRATCRDPRYQQAYFSRPMAERIELVRSVRSASEAGKRTMEEMLMDVNPQAIGDLMQRLDVNLMIHGHTHRPGCHRIGGRTRWVLPDWDAAAPRGDLLAARDGELWMLGDRR